MIRMIMHGCNGRMGTVISNLAKENKDIEIVAGVDTYTEANKDYPVFKSIAECDIDADVVVDFSNAKAVDGLLDVCVKRQLPVVLCTTGLSEEQLDKVKEATLKVAVLRSANMSLGVNLLMELVKKATSTLQGEGFDIEIVEKHHKHKLDAPSGTAIALADAANEVANPKYRYNFDRSSERREREDSEIGLSAVRGGSITGEHDVIFAGLDEVITLSHTAYSRDIFGKGALSAAMYLAGKGAGLYSMQDVIKEKLEK